MPLLSSPVAYPPSSSLPVIPEKRKRSDHPSPLPESKRRNPTNTERGVPIERPFSRSLPLDFFSEKATAAVPHPNGATLPRGPFLDDDDDEELEDKEHYKKLFTKGRDTAVDSETRHAIERYSDIGETPPILLSPREPDDTIKVVPRAKTSSGKAFRIYKRKAQPSIPYEQLIASRSATTAGKACKSFYGVNIHELLDQAAKEAKPVADALKSRSEVPHPSIEATVPSKGLRKGRTMLWTEKYRARKFTDLVGDERTHRDVLRWLKGWDPVVFPGSARPRPNVSSVENEAEPRQHRKVLLLTGPPGLGKTTLAHVCARQAGYEIVEINASDERSRDVVKGRIRDCVGTENVRGINTKEAKKASRKAGRPVCLIVDEVDGVVGGSSGGGEGGFIKALIDLVTLDQKNSTALGATSSNIVKIKKKSDRFRLLRPIILICNDVYHPALRPLRSSTIAEVIQIRKPPLEKVVTRLKSVFDKEGVPCDSDGVRRLCEATWGVSNRRESRANSNGTGEGDMRGILVVGEWVAAKMRASVQKGSKLTKGWVEEHMIANLSYDGDGARGLGRGSTHDSVERVFLEDAGFPKSVSAPKVENLGKFQGGDAAGVSELAKRTAMHRLRDLVDTNSESDRVVIDCFAAYPTRSWQDDTFLSKPNAAYEWLHFHDRISSMVHTSQEWELAPYLSHSILGFHHLFASPAKRSWSSDQKRWDENDDEEPLPFSGPRADYSAIEITKQNKAVLAGLQSSLSIPLHRSFRSAEDLSTDLLPHLIKMLTPDVKPIVVGGSGDQSGTVSVRKECERQMIQHAVGIMGAVGVTFERAKLESSRSGTSSYIYRMEPPLDNLAAFETAAHDLPTHPVRYLIRQALDQEYQKFLLRRSAESRQARFDAGGDLNSGVDATYHNEKNDRAEAISIPKITVHKRDFFGRIIEHVPSLPVGESSPRQQIPKVEDDLEDRKVWVSFHEGFSNAVRKPITLEELLRGL